MNAFDRFVEAISPRSSIPPSYGFYHIFCIILVIALTVALCVFFRNANEKVMRRILLIAWICMVIGEGYKQLVFSMNIHGGVAVWAYPWYSFPFQLCATPLYFLPFAIFCRGKIQEIAIVFLSTFAFFGGLVVMIYPGDVFASIIGINIQTMVHHGLQVAIGIYLAVYKRKELCFKHFLKSIPAFVVAISFALILNVVFYHAYPAGDSGVPVFNMFFISPYFPCTLPLLSLIYPIVPYPVFLLIYIIGFTVAALAVYYAIFGIYRLVLKVFNNEKQNN